MSRHRKDGAPGTHAPRPQVSDAQAARLLCTHADTTPPWARAAIDSVWPEVRFGFAVGLARGESIAEQGGLVVDLDAVPGGRMLDPEGGTIGLAVGRAKVRELAATWVDEFAAMAVDEDPGPRGVWFLVALPGLSQCIARVFLSVAGDVAPAEAFAVGGAA